MPSSSSSSAAASTMSASSSSSSAAAAATTMPSSSSPSAAATMSSPSPPKVAAAATMTSPSSSPSAAAAATTMPLSSSPSAAANMSSPSPPKVAAAATMTSSSSSPSPPKEAAVQTSTAAAMMTSPSSPSAAAAATTMPSSSSPSAATTAVTMSSPSPPKVAAAATMTSSSSSPSPPKEAAVQTSTAAATMTSPSSSPSTTAETMMPSPPSAAAAATMSPPSPPKVASTATMTSPSSSPSPPKEAAVQPSTATATMTSSSSSPSAAAMQTSGAGTSRVSKGFDVRASVPEIVSEPDDDQVLICSSNSSLRRRNSSCLKRITKNKRSRLLEKGDEGAAPSLEEDLPDDFNKMKYNAVSVVQLLSLVLLIPTLLSTLIIHLLRKRELFGLAVWKWELVILVLTSGRILSGWGIKVILHFISRKMTLRKRVLYFLYDMKSALQNCIWASLVTITWVCIFDKKLRHIKNARMLSGLSKIWACLLVGTAIWLLKTLGVMILASSFHVSTFFDRIQEALFNQYVIETLLMIRVNQHQEPEQVMVEVERTIGTSKSKNGTVTVDLLHRLNKKNVSSWNMKKLVKIVRKGELSTRDEDDQSMVPITSEDEAKAAGKKVFLNVAKPGSTHIYLEDLMRFMREEEALKTMHLFEEDGTERISKRALKNWAVTAFKERRTLAMSLDDTKTAVNKLHQILNVVVGVVIVVVCLLILKIATTHFLIFLGSQVLLAVFMFGNMRKTTFEAIVFMFVMHPYDVGDRVEIDGVQMIVDEMSLLTTAFLTSDNFMIYFPNSLLSTKPIKNFDRD